MDRICRSIKGEIYSLVRLPEYLSRMKEKHSNVADYISYPVLRVDETGFLVSDDIPVEVEGIKLANRNSRIERHIKRRITKARLLTEAIQLLNKQDRELLISYFTKTKSEDIQEILMKIYSNLVHLTEVIVCEGGDQVQTKELEDYSKEELIRMVRMNTKKDKHALIKANIKLHKELTILREKENQFNECSGVATETKEG